MKDLPQDGTIDAGLLLLELKYGDTPLSQADIAQACGTTPQNIQQYEYRALRKLRAEFLRRGIDREYLR